jgi:large subunit ribosomal protein L25
VAGQESIDVEVPIHFVGDAPGVKLEGGVLDPVLTHLQVRCAPDQIPEVIEVDVSQMQVKDILYVHQLVLPEGITALGELERTVVTVIASKVNAAAEAEAEEAAAEPASEPDTESA